jgi:hypothetical protein
MNGSTPHISVSQYQSRLGCCTNRFQLGACPLRYLALMLDRGPRARNHSNESVLSKVHRFLVRARSMPLIQRNE